MHESYIGIYSYLRLLASAKPRGYFLQLLDFLTELDNIIMGISYFQFKPPKRVKLRPTPLRIIIELSKSMLMVTTFTMLVLT